MKSSTKHGGRRSGAGRPQIDTAKTIRKTITLTPSDLAYLTTIDPNISKSIRILIERGRP